MNGINNVAYHISSEDIGVAVTPTSGVAPDLVRSGDYLCSQWRSQNTEKNMHIRWRLLDQAVIQFNCVPFHNGNFP